jgi:hypothetical protein
MLRYKRGQPRWLQDGCRRRRCDSSDIDTTRRRCSLQQSWYVSIGRRISLHLSRGLSNVRLLSRIRLQRPPCFHSGRADRRQFPGCCWCGPSHSLDPQWPARYRYPVDRRYKRSQSVQCRTSQRKDGKNQSTSNAGCDEVSASCFW